MDLKKFLSALTNWITKVRPFLIAISISPWLIILYILISTYAESFSTDDLSIIEKFIEWFGTAYSLFLALVLVNVWNQFTTTDNDFDREVDALSTLYETAKYAKATSDNKEPSLGEFRKSIFDDIELYLRHVIANYQKEHTILRQRRRGEKLLENMGSHISSLGAEKIIIDPLCNELFRNLNEARDARGDRISHSIQRMPPALWIVAVISSLVWLLPFFALKIENLYIKLFLISGAAFVSVVFLIIINDFDGPFDGTWRVSVDSWRDFLEVIDPNPHIIFVLKNNNRLNDWLSRVSIGKSFGLPACKLSALKRESLGLPWVRFLRGIQRYHPNKIKKIRYDTFYFDDFNRQGYELKLEPKDLPVVLIKTGDDPNKLIETEEIMKCSKLEDFEKLLYIKIKSRISDFDEWTERQ